MRVLVTGGVRRVGAAIVAELRQGHEVAAHFHSTHPTQGTSFQADLSTPEGCKELARQARAWGVTALVNNAGDWRRSTLEEITDQDWEHMLGLNLRAPFMLARELSDRLEAVVNITDSILPRKGYTHYATSKGGLDMLTRQLALDLAPACRVNAVAPGTVMLPEGMDPKALLQRIPLGRLGSGEAVARAVRFLLEADYITGETLRVDGGRHLC